MEFKFSIDEDTVDKIVVEGFIDKLKKDCHYMAESWAAKDEIKAAIKKSLLKQIEVVAEKIFADMPTIEAECRTAIKEKIMRKLERIK